MRIGLKIQLCIFLFPLLAAALGVPLTAAEDAAGKRLILIKVDGLPPDLMAAVAFPDNPKYMKRLAYAEDLQKQIRFYRQQTGRQIILPNIRHYFFEDGVYVENIYSETLTLSAVAWAVLDTGHASVIKGHATFSRDTSYLRSHLDGLRDTIDAIRHGESKTAALWNLDQIGDSLMLDAFDWDRTWTGPQIYRRQANRELLIDSGIRWLNNDQQGIGNIIESHLSRLVTGIDYTEYAQEMAGRVATKKVLETDLTGKEQFDYISPFFTLMDHQQHVDPHPENLIHWLVKLDILVGDLFSAVEQSQRRDDTVVAMVSDHGSEIDPGKVAYSFPITRVFRTPEFGSHTVKTLLVEGAWKALSVPLPGIDFPRIYESPTSPYGKGVNGREGDDDFVTCFIDPFGNSRSSVNLRNNDLNRLHLLLLELRKNPSRLEPIRKRFQETLEQTKSWLEPDFELMRDYQEGASDLARNLEKRTDTYSLDVAWRLREEVKRDQGVLESLQRLLQIRFLPDQGGLYFDDLFASGDFKIEDYIPKQYLGLANNVYQLTHYTVGLDPDLNWIDTTENAQGERMRMDYFQIMDDYDAVNPPAPGLENPYDLIVTRIPEEQIGPVLIDRHLIQGVDRLKNVIWLKSTQEGQDGRGKEALIIQRKDGRIKYVPIKDFTQNQELEIDFQFQDSFDPLGLLKSADFKGPARPERVQWLGKFRLRGEIEEAISETYYSIGMLIVLDIVNDPAPEFIDNPEFLDFLVSFSSPEMKQRYLRGLKRKYASQQPDFTVWANTLWNFNSKARTSGGSHSGLKPIVSRTAFVIWGGQDTAVAHGKVVSEVATTLDVVPTLYRALDMLDGQKQVIRRPGSVPERPFLTYPGEVLDIWKRPSVELAVPPDSSPRRE